MNLGNVSVNFTNSVKIANVKKQLEEKTGIAVNKQQIIHSGRELRNNFTVGEYILKNSGVSILRIKSNVGGTKNITTTKKKVRKIYEGLRGRKYFISKGCKIYI